MALPKSLLTARMTNATVGSSIDDHVGALETTIADLLGVPIDTPLNSGDTMNLPLQLNIPNNRLITWGGTGVGLWGNNVANGYVSFRADGINDAMRIYSGGIVFRGDLNTFIGPVLSGSTPVADAIRIVSAGSEKVRINTSGLVLGGDLDTYIHLSSANTIGFTAGGVLAFRIDPGGPIFNASTLVLAGDTDTFFGHPAANTLSMHTANVEQLRVDSVGNVILKGDLNTYLYHPAVDTLALATAGLDRIRVSPSGTGISNGPLHFGADVTTGFDNPATNVIALTMAGVERFRFYTSGVLLINETSNAFQNSGITIAQPGTSDNLEAISLKSSINHGMTTITEQNTYGILRKNDPAEGALHVFGFGNSSQGLSLSGAAVGPTTTDTTASQGVVQIWAVKRSGSSVGSLAVAENILSVQNFQTTHFLIKGNGALHATDTDGATALDAYDDAQLVRALDLASDPAGAIRSRWDDYVRYNRQDLIAAGIYAPDEPDGSRGLMNLSQHRKLLHGAIWQLYAEIQELKEWKASRSGCSGWLNKRLANLCFRTRSRARKSSSLKNSLQRCRRALKS